MPDNDLDDFITINVTCDQADALAKLLERAFKVGLWEKVLNRYEQRKLDEFARTMTMEIELQKTGMGE